jgi:diacylglycerol kinase family enzyme
MISITAWSPSAPTENAFNSTTILPAGGDGTISLIVGNVAGGHGERKK